MKCWLKAISTQLPFLSNKIVSRFEGWHYINFLKALLTEETADWHLAIKIKSPQPWGRLGWGTYCFCCGSCWHQYLHWCSLSVLCLCPYLVNRWVDYNQTQMDTSLGWGKQVIDFGDHNPIFKVTWSNFTKCLSAPIIWIQTKLGWLYN